MRNVSFQLVIVAALVTSLLSTGCGSDDNSNDPGPSEKASIRLLHLGYDVQALDVRVNGVVAVSNGVYGQSSGYKEVLPGNNTISVHFTGVEAARASAVQTMIASNAYTVYAFPPAAAFSASVANDPRDAEPGKARIKFVNATLPDQDMKFWYIDLDSSKVLTPQPIKLTGNTQYTDIESKKYMFVVETPTAWMVYDSVILASGAAYTLVAHGTTTEGDAYPFGVRMFRDDGTGTEFVDLSPATPSGTVSFVHAVPGGPAVDVALDGGSPIVTNLTYQTATTYIPVTAGNHTVSVSSGGTPIINNIPVVVEDRKAYTVFATGTLVPPDIAPLALLDERRPNTQQALVRFVNLSPDAGAYDVAISFAGNDNYKLPGCDNVSYRNTSRSLATGRAFVLVPAGDYSFRFVKTSTTDLLVTAPLMNIAAGRIYTVWLGGTTATGSLVVNAITHN